MTLEDLQAQAAKAARELLDTAGLREGDILVVGCSSSEVGGRKIGTDSSPKVAQAVFAGIYLSLIHISGRGHLCPAAGENPGGSPLSGRGPGNPAALPAVQGSLCHQ